jgi:hypothetical protein
MRYHQPLFSNNEAKSSFSIHSCQKGIPIQSHCRPLILSSPKDHGEPVEMQVERANVAAHGELVESMAAEISQENPALQPTIILSLHCASGPCHYSPEWGAKEYQIAKTLEANCDGIEANRFAHFCNRDISEWNRVRPFRAIAARSS